MATNPDATQKQLPNCYDTKAEMDKRKQTKPFGKSRNATSVSSKYSPGGSHKRWNDVLPKGTVTKHQMEERVPTKRETGKDRNVEVTKKSQLGPFHGDLQHDYRQRLKGSTFDKEYETKHFPDLKSEMNLRTSVSSKYSPGGSPKRWNDVLPKRTVTKHQMEERVRTKRKTGKDRNVEVTKESQFGPFHGDLQHDYRQRLRGSTFDKEYETKHSPDLESEMYLSTQTNTEVTDVKPDHDTGDLSRYNPASRKHEDKASLSCNKLGSLPEKQSRVGAAVAGFKPYRSAPCISPSTKRSQSVYTTIITMNVDGPYDDRGSVPDRRRSTIQSVVLNHRPALVLFQEFKWKGISGSIWTSSPIPEQYVYFGHAEAGIMYDASSVYVENLTVDIRSILSRLQRTASNELGVTFPMEFDPFPRMCALVVTPQCKQAGKFLCISWHGIYRKLTESKRVEYFRYLMEFLRNIHTKIKLPVLIAGDFNVRIDSIHILVKDPFVLSQYVPSRRRKASGVIDYFIVSRDLCLKHVEPINLEKENPGDYPNDVLDHDPVIASLSLSSFP